MIKLIKEYILILYHATALKKIPLCGSMLEAAIAFTVLSTDKAVG